MGLVCDEQGGGEFVPYAGRPPGEYRVSGGAAVVNDLGAVRAFKSGAGADPSEADPPRATTLVACGSGPVSGVLRGARGALIRNHELAEHLFGPPPGDRSNVGGGAAE